MSLATPEKIRILQRKLYRKAKAEPAFRFYVLYDKICREDILRHAYAVSGANAGAAGVDGVSFAQIEASGLEACRVGRSAEKSGEVLDPLHVVMLGLRRELADRHVFDHALPQRAYGLIGHEGCSCLD
jgi:RNA-directed DNA polymerase